MKPPPPRRAVGVVRRLAGIHALGHLPGAFEEMRLLAFWGRTLWGVFFVSQDVLVFGRTDRPWKNKWKCVYYSASIYCIYIYLYYDYLLPYNMSKFKFVTCIYDASICLLILSIHTFVCLLFLPI